MLGAGGEHSELCHIGPCGDRRFGRSVGEFETCFGLGRVSGVVVLAAEEGGREAGAEAEGESARGRQCAVPNS